MKLVIVSGFSGAGKTIALHTLEDLGFYTVDNLPIPLLKNFVDLLETTENHIEKAAIVIDIRNRIYLDEWDKIKNKLLQAGHYLQIIFLKASQKAIIKRYKTTRRPHPLGGRSLLKTIKTEKEFLSRIISDNSIIVDTSELSVHELRSKILNIFSQYPRPELIINIVSFGFSRGILTEADLVFDVRFLPNPYFMENLSGLPGNSPQIIKFFQEHEEPAEFLDKTLALLTYLIPKYQKEGKTYLNCGIGCTGGKHRSVYITEELSRLLKTKGFNSEFRHRDLNLELLPQV
ncbi:MAG: RNase adapter RapZ [Myxococcota bacterium]